MYKYGIKIMLRNRKILLMTLALIFCFSTSFILDNVAQLSLLIEEAQIQRFRAADLVVWGDSFSQEFIDAVMGLNNVEACTPLLTHRIYLNMGGNIYTIQIYGIPKDPQVNTIPDIDWDEFCCNRVIVDSDTASILDIKVNDHIDIFGEYFVVYRIARILWAPSLELSGEGAMVINYYDLYRLLNYSVRYNTLNIRLRDKSRIMETAYSIYDLGKSFNYSLVIHPQYRNIEILVESFSKFLSIIKLTMFSSVVLISLAYVALDIREKRRELGLFELMGATLSEIANMYLLQIIIVVSLSVLVALLLSSFVALFLVTKSVSFLHFDIYIPMILNIPIKTISLLVIIDLFSCWILCQLSLRNLAVEDIVRGYSLKVHKKHKKGKTKQYRSCKTRIVLRRISQEKHRTFLLILLLASTISLPIALKSIIVVGSESYRRSIEHSMLWDIMINVYDVTKYDKIREYVRRLGGVEICEEILYVGLPIARISGGGTSIRPPFSIITLIGMNGRERLIKFRYTDGTLAQRGIVISTKIARILGVGIGDYLEISAYHYLGFEVSVYLTIVGIVDTSIAGGYLLIIHPHELQSLAGVNRTINNTLLIKMTDKSKVNSTLYDLARYMNENKIDGNIVARDAMLRKAFHVEKRFLAWIIPAVIMSQIFLGIATVIIIRKEFEGRNREIAILYALGLTRREMVKQYMIEYGIILLLSTIISCILLWTTILLLTEIINSTLSPLWIHPYCPPRTYIECIYVAIIILLAILLTIHVNISRVDLKENLSIPE